MPNKKISELDSFDQLIGNEKFPIVQSGTNKTSDVSTLGTKLNSDVSSAITPYATRVSSNLASAKTSNLTSDLTTIQDLTGIKSNLHVSPNAVTAMFVYDTSKDSDGGAWTEKCSSTSWYNETLSGNWLGAVTGTSLALCETAARAISGATTGDYYQASFDGKFYSLNSGSGYTEVFRGNKRSFPKLVGIIAEATNITIYDLTEAGRPMWMRFNDGGTTGIIGWASSVLKSQQCLSMLNGILFVGSNAGGIIVNMIKDDTVLVFDTVYYLTRNKFISERNNITGFVSGGNGIAISGYVINSVGMTVLPDAPIDSVTGLKVPTIAIATNSGISILKHNGSIINSSSTSSFNSVSITPTLLSAGRADNIWYYAYNPGNLGSSFTLTTIANTTSPDWATGNNSAIINGTRSDMARFTYAGTTNIFTKLKNFESTPSKSLSAKISSFYNTGYLVGDIRRAYLSNIISESITNSELVSNGKFDINLSGWDNSLGAWSWNAGKATSTTNGWAGDLVIYGGIVGKTYEATFTITDAVGSGIYISLAGNDIGYYGNGTFRIVSTCTSTTKFFRIRKFPSDGGSIDNISIKESDIDYSYKSIGASLYGALSKSPVANNAQLVGYSGFSNSNYLREPASTDLDFGTGEWSSSCWINIPTTITASNIFHRGYSSGALFELKVDATGKIIATITDSAATPVTRTITSTNTYNTGTWNKVDVTYATNGTLSLYVNGQQAATPVTGSALASISNTNAVLTIGNNYSLNAPFPGSLSLLKLSATVPTTEQLQWMYEQEKMMFQSGAHVCLPSSNAVNDLSYDSKTDTWYVVQPSHVSEWKGLVRTAYRKPATSTYSKIASDSGVKLIARASGTVELEIAPIQLKKEFSSSVIDSTINNQNISIFEFDSIASQTDFVLPVGYTAQSVYLAGTLQIEGASKNYTRLFDGFRETIRFGTAPATNSWVKIKAVRS